MKLYDTNGAPNPRRVRIFMAEKGVDCEKVELNIVKGENLTEEFLAINPRGMMPTLELDDGTRLTQGRAIMYYLANEYGFYPKDNMDVYKSEHILTFVYEEFFPQIMKLFFAKTDEEKGAVVQDIMANHFPKCMSNLSKKIPEGNKFILGDKLHQIDIMVGGMMVKKG